MEHANSRSGKAYIYLWFSVKGREGLRKGVREERRKGGQREGGGMRGETDKGRESGRKGMREEMGMEEGKAT